GRQDYVIVAVKGQSLPEVAASIGPLLGPGTAVVTAMNGVPWWFFDRLPFGEGKLRLESLDPSGTTWALASSLANPEDEMSSVPGNWPRPCEAPVSKSSPATSSSGIS